MFCQFRPGLAGLSQVTSGNFLFRQVRSGWVSLSQFSAG
jgi:hypothetical protein